MSPKDQTTTAPKLASGAKPRPELAADLARWCRDTINHAASAFAAQQKIALRLGGQVDERGRATFAFWTPELQEARVPDSDVFLHVMRPVEPFDLTRVHQTVRFDALLLPVARYESHTFAVVDGLVAGSRDQVGDFYSLLWRDYAGEWHRILDPLAASLPYGAMAPAELYDVVRMQADRGDAAYWERIRTDGVTKIGPASNILQIHVPTATAGGTLASLARQFERLAERVRSDLPKEPIDNIYLGYDAVQLLPVEPTTVHEAGPPFWDEVSTAEDSLEVELVRPDTTNWGYDVVISGMGAVNPVLLESARPDELIDLAVALHNFPRPKKLILDVVFGHADNQGFDALNTHFFAGPNMYGQNLQYKDPAVRAILLEMQRRKVDYGADGVRVDGAQDFKVWDPSDQRLHHDDAYLQAMSDVEQEVAGTRYRPWMIFEDGRPWPDPDWELSSTYREVIDEQRDDDVFQWGPLSFAHNTPFVYTFWLSKFWRIEEMLKRGANWISGTANHDTLRRGTQVNPELNINTRLGETKMEILDKAYDNPVVSLLTYAVFPGVPMDFLNATARASWGFIRNQDDRWGVKILAEEAISLKWQVDEYSYSRPGSFRRLKAIGFETRVELARFLEFLPALVKVTEYDLGEIAKLLNKVEPALSGPDLYSVPDLKKIARAWMDDMHEYCNVANTIAQLDPRQTQAMLDLREFRRSNTWLRESFGEGDVFDYLRPIDGRTVFVALRHAPDGRQIYAVAHMEGRRTEPLDPLTLAVSGIEGEGWRPVWSTPAVPAEYAGGPIVLRDSIGLLYQRG